MQQTNHLCYINEPWYIDISLTKEIHSKDGQIIIEYCSSLYSGINLSFCNISSIEHQEFYKIIHLIDKLKHPNIVQFIGVVFDNNTPIYLLYEKVKTLQNIIPFNNKDYNIISIIDILKQIANGLLYLHSQNLAFGRLDFNNIFIKRTLVKLYLVGTNLLFFPDQNFTVYNDIYDFGLLIVNLLLQKTKTYITFSDVYSVLNIYPCLKNVLFSCFHKDLKRRYSIKKIISLLSEIQQQFKPICSTDNILLFSHNTQSSEDIILNNSNIRVYNNNFIQNNFDIASVIEYDFSSETESESDTDIKSFTTLLESKKDNQYIPIPFDNTEDDFTLPDNIEMIQSIGFSMNNSQDFIPLQSNNTYKSFTSDDEFIPPKKVKKTKKSANKVKKKTTAKKVHPQQVSTNVYSKIVTGSGTTFFISNDGNKTVYSVGQNLASNLGHLGIIRKPTQIPSLYNISQIACGARHTIFCDDTGQLFSVGCNKYGKLGIRKKYNRCKESHIPQKIDIPPIKTVSCGLQFTVCSSYDSNTYSFGRNNEGQLGIGNKADRYSPVIIAGLIDVNLISCLDVSVLCITQKTECYAWGLGYCGRLGRGNTDSELKPVKCTLWPNNIISMKSGLQHTLFLTASGNVYSFGHNLYGQTGVSKSEKNIKVPTLLPNLPKMKQISCYAYQSLCIDINNRLWVFGKNACGQLGLGDRNNRFQPILNENIADIKEANAGSAYTIIITNDNKVYACGYNRYTQFGTKTKSKVKTQLSPVLVFE